MDRGGDDPRGPWVWIAIGCGGLALSALCLVPPVLWLASDAAGEDASPPLVVEPGPPRAPSPPMPPLPPPPPSPSLPPLPAPPSPGFTSPRRVEAVVESSTGLASVRAGSACAFDVTRHDRPDGTFWCNAQVICAGQLLYGGPNAGFFSCTLYEQPERHVVGEDASMTREDGDAAMRLDTLRRVLTVRDDSSGPRGAFNLRARVTSIR